MFYELVATVVAGIGAGGVAYLANRLAGGRLPRWAVPVAAGLAMLVFTLWSETTWAGRTEAALPDGVAVVERVSETIVWKPWTILYPQTTRLIAVDLDRAQDNPAAPGIRLVELYLFARWQPTRAVPQLLDCPGARRADVSDAALADPGAAVWTALPPDAPLLTHACPDELERRRHATEDDPAG